MLFSMVVRTKTTPILFTIKHQNMSNINGINRYLELESTPPNSQIFSNEQAIEPQPSWLSKNKASLDELRAQSQDVKMPVVAIRDAFEKNPHDFGSYSNIPQKPTSEKLVEVEVNPTIWVTVASYAAIAYILAAKFQEIHG